MQGDQQITFQITTQQGEPKTIAFDKKILNFNIQYLSNNHHQPYPIPKNIAKSLRPFQIMRQFVVAHQYDPTSVKVVKPIKSTIYSEVVDPITFKIFSKYNDNKLNEQIQEVIILSRFLRFQQLTDAISAAVAVNYYISEDQKQIDDFMKNNGLEGISSQEICQIIQLYEEQFRLIQYKAKQEMLRISESQLANQS